MTPDEAKAMNDRFIRVGDGPTAGRAEVMKPYGGVNAATEIDHLRAQLRVLRRQNEAYRKALEEVERHHVKRNGEVGRPEANSHTLEVVRKALAEGAANDT